ncbi:tumor necrosis factor receptor superfamily member 6B precursor [Danio rerio]|uniref:Tumor necrosis factor receptor superfamily member 6B precursor n=1 Tax=Danio rerio TaxID=7955 RepID=A0AB13AAW4_DANRE|nr:tumor necrosis factor receptor superfamily member 6B precursor [Danio rerio]
MLFSTVLAIWALTAGDARTYRRKDPETGRTLECARCAPGSRLRQHCSSSRQTECSPCGPGMYTEFWNYIPDCLLCDSCAEHQRVVQPCNGIANTVCECEEGFYWEQHFCRRHSVCRPGHGVKTAGTPYSDTVCEACAEGHFSDATKAHAQCVKHRVCQGEEHLLLSGNTHYNSICTTCQQLSNNGTVWTAVFDPALSALQVQQKIDIHRLEQMVIRRLKKPLKQLHKRTAMRRADPSEGLIDRSMMLENSYLSHLAQRMTQNIRRVQQSCNNIERNRSGILHPNPAAL